jgi:ABC-2 type transport system ATP-binding protein
MSDSNEIVISVEDLVRVYRSSTGLIRKKRKETVAVDHISFEVKRGELFGLLGPNGAGKTTVIKVLTTLLLPTSGKVKVLGYDVQGQSQEVRKHIGLILGGERGLYYRVTGRQNLRYFADLYGVPIREREKRISEVLKAVDLTDRADERVEDYSRGMKQRLHIAKGIVHDPELIFMDEPTIGLDPQAARDARRMVKDLQKAGKTILLTTHYMYEADELCNRLGVIAHGKILALDTPSGLKDLGHRGGGFRADRHRAGRGQVDPRGQSCQRDHERGQAGAAGPSIRRKRDADQGREQIAGQQCHRGQG